ncbi:MAG: PHP domain-containing protein [Clostridia bacterium]|nr:PHP domain-containing protein [Clostridia bacterium]
MKRYLLPEEGKFYKASLHVHTTCSDGLATPEEIKKMYMEKGYSIVAYTDHEVIVPHNDLRDENFLPITGAEISVNKDIPGLSYRYSKQYHLNILSKDPEKRDTSFFTLSYLYWKSSIPYLTEQMKATEYPREYNNDCVNDIIRRAKEEGFLIALNHPGLSGQNYPDYAYLKGFWGVEVHNSGSVGNGRVEGEQPLIDLLELGERVFPLATDDMHGAYNQQSLDAIGGWTMVKAPALEYGAVMDSLEKGDFYSSTGPEIYALYLDGETLVVECSDASLVRVNTERRVSMIQTAEDGPLTRVCFDMHPYFEASFEKNMLWKPYFRVTVQDANGGHAYTRAYFLDELEGVSYAK